MLSERKKLTKLYKAHYDCFRVALKKIEIVVESIPQLTFQLYSLFILKKSILDIIRTDTRLFQSILTSILSLAFNINTLIKNDFPIPVKKPNSDGNIKVLFYFLKVYFLVLNITSGIILNAELFAIINPFFASCILVFKSIVFLAINYCEMKKNYSKNEETNILQNNKIINFMNYILYFGYLNIGIYKNLFSVSNKRHYTSLKVMYGLYFIIFTFQTFLFLIIHAFFYNNSFEWFLLYFVICYNLLFILNLYVWFTNNARPTVVS